MPTNNSWNNTISAANSTLNGGTASLGTDNAANAINIGQGTVARAIGIGNSAAAHVVTIGSTNGAAQTALQYGTADFTLASATGTVVSVLDTGEMTKPLQVAFMAYLGSTDNNVTGNSGTYTLGSVTALTEVFDQNSDFNTNGTFTAPITGRYQLNSSCKLIGCTVGNTINSIIVTSNRNYSLSDGRPGTTITMGIGNMTLADMDAADTATIQLIGVGEAANTEDAAGTAIQNYISGFLAC